MFDRDALLADPGLEGRHFCAAYRDAVDEWLAQLLLRATSDVEGVALVAVGGYGRGELSPQSDLDVVLLHDGRRDVADLADRVWYPVWDAGLKLGHAVRTTAEALDLAERDLDTATSLLEARAVAGDARLTTALSERALRQWQRRSKRWLAELARSVADRHQRAGEVAFLLEPDLKEGRGGLRDVQSLRWAEAGRHILLQGDAESLAGAYGELLDARVELHRRTGRAGDRLLLQEQDAVAEALGDADADALMARLSAAARTIAWTSDEAWDRIGSSLRGPLGRLARRDRPVAPGVVVREGEVHLAADASPADDPVLVLRAAVAAARLGTRIDRPSLDWLALEAPPLPDPWPPEARPLLADLLLAGLPALAVLEALDQRGLLVRVLPEWAPVRSRPQRNAYHRFTVDRHLCEAAVGAAALAGRVERPDLLVIGALLHDLGKGYPGDHTDAGVDLVATIGPRMGFPPGDVDTLTTMVRHHLLLADVATRRDLDDDATIAHVAEAVGAPSTLALLAALTEADSVATGPAAWGPWKAQLVAELVARTARVLGGVTAVETVGPEFPTPELKALMAAGQQVVEADGDTLTVVAPDRPGLFSRVAGVLALHGLGVLEAAAHSSDEMALARFRVESSFGPVVAWAKVLDDVDRALAGRLAVQARLADRARTYTRRQPAAARATVPQVMVDNDASEQATVVEVHAADAVGVLYRITRALADLDLDIRRAKVQTLGHEVVDAFYVRDSGGGKITDPVHLVELERALIHALTA